MDVLAKKLLKAQNVVTEVANQSVDTLINQQAKVSEPSEDKRTGGEDQPNENVVISQDHDGDDQAKGQNRKRVRVRGQQSGDRRMKET